MTLSWVIALGEHVSTATISDPQERAGSHNWNDATAFALDGIAEIRGSLRDDPTLAIAVHELVNSMGPNTAFRSSEDGCLLNKLLGERRAEVSAALDKLRALR